MAWTATRDPSARLGGAPTARGPVTPGLSYQVDVGRPLPLERLPSVGCLDQEYAQLLTSLFLAIAGPGLLSLDARMRGARARAVRNPAPTAHPSLREPAA